jgi:hypothetical protein
VVARINTSVISKGDDFGRANTNPRIRHGKYASLDYEPGTSHWVVIRGIGRDDLGRWVIVHDPYVFNEGIHWYSDDMAKGRNRYFAYTEFEEALVAGSAREIMGHARPRLAARLYEQPKPRVLPPGEQASIAFSLQNVGWQTWEAGHYALVNVNDEPLDVPLEQIALDVDVPLGRSVRWPLTITVPLEPRLYRAEWQLSYDGELLGPVLAVSVLVRPDELGDVASMLEWAKKDARRYAEEWLTDRWEALWRQIMKALEREAERKARKLLRDLCGGPAATTAMSLALAWLGRRGYAPENEEDR